MRRLLPLFMSGILLAACALLGGSAARAQVAPAAVGPLGLSAFGGATGTFTGLYGGHNLGVTAGGDLELPPIWRLRPSAEVRATYPFKQGHWDGQKSVLAGARENVHVRALETFRIVPFGDLLFGWGRLSYPRGFPSLDGTYDYFHTSGFVFSPGAGAELRVTSRFSLKGDIQLQHWSTPVIRGGSIWSKPLTGSIVYRFDRFHTRRPYSDEP